MLEPMTVRAEVWPVAADATGLWLLSGDDAWRSDAVMADASVHGEVELLLYREGIEHGAALLHSTSWRADGTSVVLTYMAVVSVRGLVRVRFPAALPITLDVARAVGKPPGHAANEVPEPRYIDVLMHGLRHLRFLQNTDATSRAAMGAHWRRELWSFKPALAGMYEDLHEPTIISEAG